MIERLEIENFRGLDKLTVDGLARVNVFVGANNVGKTSLLEAILLLEETQVTVPLEAILARRRYVAGGDSQRMLALLRSQSSSAAVKLTGVRGDAQWHTQFLEKNGVPQSIVGHGPVEAAQNWPSIDIAFSHTGARTEARPRAVWFDFNAMTDEQLSDQIGALWEAGDAGEIAEWLQQIDPRVIQVAQQKVTGSTCAEAWVELKGLPRKLRLTHAGHGLRFATALFLELRGQCDAVVLVDEIEVGLHHEALKAVWQTIDCLSRRNSLQLFVTTHSYDCLKAVQEAMNGSPSELACFRLQRGDSGHIVAVRISSETLGTMVAMDIEVR